MTEHTCTYGDRRDETLVAYLYEEMDGAERALFEPHLASCAACRAELAALGGVRTELARWSPPEPRDVLTSRLEVTAASGGRAWHDLPAWARTAAAVLVGAAALGIANLDVRYDDTGLTVRSGWMDHAPEPAAVAPAAADTLLDERVAGLREELRREIAAQQAAAPAAQLAPAARTSRDESQANADVLRQVRALVADSESRQQRELALRVADIKRGVDAQRQTDLVRIERALGIIQSQTGITAMRQGQMINSLAVKVGQIQ